MEKIQIKPNEIQDWMRESWYLYSSQSIRKKSLRLWINLLSQYRVKHGEDVLYEGPYITHAIAAWENVKT